MPNEKVDFIPKIIKDHNLNLHWKKAGYDQEIRLLQVAASLEQARQLGLMVSRLNSFKKLFE